MWFSAGPLKTDYLCLETDALSIWIVLSIRLKTNLQAEIACLHVMGNFLNFIFKPPPPKKISNRSILKIYRLILHICFLSLFFYGD